MIHWGNDPKDTEGYILVGQNQSADETSQSSRYLASMSSLPGSKVEITVISD